MARELIKWPAGFGRCRLPTVGSVSYLFVTIWALFSAFQTASSRPEFTVVDFLALAALQFLTRNNNWQFVGAPHYYRILEYVQTPSRSWAPIRC